MRRVELMAVVAFAALVWAGGCGGSDNTDAPKATPGNPASAMPQGGPLSGVVATTLPVHVTIADSTGIVVPNAIINFVVTSGGGSVFAPAVASSAAGVASDQWTLGTTAGRQTLEARWVEPATGSPHVLGTLTATAEAGPFARINLRNVTVSAFAGYKATLEQMFARVFVQAVDTYGNPVPFSTVTLSATSGLALSGDTLTALTVGYQKLYFAGGPGVRDSLTVSVMEDMRKSRWRTTYRCVQGYGYDSLLVAVASDSVSYGVQPVVSGRNSTFWWYFTGAVTKWNQGVSSTSDTTFNSFHVQVPDSVEVQPSYAVLQPDSSYVGGTLCPAPFPGQEQPTLRVERF